MVRIPSVFQLVNASIQIRVGEIRIFCISHVHQLEVDPIGHLIDDTYECFCLSGHCEHKNWFQSGCKCWMPQHWSCLDDWNAVGHWIQSPHGISLSFVTNNPRIVVLRHIQLLVKGIPPQINSGNPRTAFSVSNLHITTAATRYMSQ